MHGYADTIDHVNVLRRQEETTYRCFDYLSPEFQQQQAIQEEFLHNCLGRIKPNANFMSESWRDKICEWAYNIVDYFNYDRELVFICMNFLDRYAMKRRVDTKTYQLAAITALFLVVKIYEPRTSSRVLDVTSLTKLSQSAFSEQSILAMEMELLQMLEWNLFPPTTHTFSMHLDKILLEVTSNLEGCARPSSKAKEEVTELTRFLIELSVCDYFFVTQLPSTVSIAALLNAMEVVGEEEYSPFLLRIFVERVYHETGLNFFSSEVQECRERLQATFAESGLSQPTTGDASHQQNNQNDDETAKEDSSLSAIPSPICVSAVNPSE